VQQQPKKYSIGWSDKKFGTRNQHVTDMVETNKTINDNQCTHIGKHLRGTGAWYGQKDYDSMFKNQNDLVTAISRINFTGVHQDYLPSQNNAWVSVCVKMDIKYTKRIDPNTDYNADHVFVMFKYINQNSIYVVTAYPKQAMNESNCQLKTHIDGGYYKTEKKWTEYFAYSRNQPRYRDLLRRRNPI